MFQFSSYYDFFVIKIVGSVSIVGASTLVNVLRSRGLAQYLMPYALQVCSVSCSLSAYVMVISASPKEDLSIHATHTRCEGTCAEPSEVAHEKTKTLTHCKIIATYT